MLVQFLPMTCAFAQAMFAQGRGGIGVKAIKLTRVRGHLIGAKAVKRGQEVFLISSSGVGIRTPIENISRQQRDSTGVKVMNLEDGTELAAYTIVPQEEE